MWTQELKELVDFREEDDGTFFISYDDYLKYYTITSVAHYYDKYNYVCGKYKFDPSKVFNMVSVKIPTSGRGYFILNQKNKRIYRNAKGVEDFSNRECNMIVFRRNQEGHFEYYCSLSGNDNRLYYEAEISAGNYIIAVTFPTEQKYDNLNYESFKQNYSKSLEDQQLSFRVGVYCEMDKVVMTPVPEKDLPQYNDFLKEIVYERATRDEHLYHFIDEGERDAWRTVTYENNNSAFGYIVYDNYTQAYINEKITVNSLSGINIIPFFFEPELHEEFNENDFEDAFDRKAINYFIHIHEPSSFKYLKLPDAKSPISATNPLIMQVGVAPYSRLVIVLEKYNTDSTIDIDSNVVFTYPPHILLQEKMVQSRKSRIKYNNKFVEIFETVSEHNNGVIFKYKNKTRDLKITAIIKFTALNNLQITSKSDELDLENEHYRESEGSNLNSNRLMKTLSSDIDYQINDKNREVAICVEPGHTKFFELNSIDIFDGFSYDCEMDYHINLSRHQITN